MPILKILIAVLLFVALPSCSQSETTAQASDAVPASQPVSATTQENDDHVDQQLLEESAAIANKRLPMDMGNNTRLDKVTAGPGRRITFHATLVDRSSEKQTSGDLSSGLPALIKTSCSNPSIQSFLDDQIAVTYKYKASDGTDITSIDVTKSLCVNASNSN